METIHWDDLRVLLAIHRHGSLLAAGKALGLSTSTTARRIEALEAALGYALVQRGRSGTQLNQTALLLTRLAEHMDHGLDAARRQHAGPTGTLRISAPEGMGQMLARTLLAVQKEYPGIELELIAENRMANVAAREADIAVRLTRSTSSVLVEKSLPSLHFALFASSDYVAKHLPSRRLREDDAARHTFVGLDLRWQHLPHEKWLRDLGATRFVFRSSSMEALLEAAHAGVGMMALLDKDPRSAGLTRIATPTAGPGQAFYLVFHHDLRKQPHVRAAVAAIAAAMGA